MINAAGAINATATIDVEATLLSMFTNQLSSMSLGELFGLGLETMIVSFGMKIMSAVITVIIFGRMIEIYRAHGSVQVWLTCIRGL